MVLLLVNLKVPPPTDSESALVPSSIKPGCETGRSLSPRPPDSRTSGSRSRPSRPKAPTSAALFGSASPSRSTGSRPCASKTPTCTPSASLISIATSAPPVKCTATRSSPNARALASASPSQAEPLRTRGRRDPRRRPFSTPTKPPLFRTFRPCSHPGYTYKDPVRWIWWQWLGFF